MKHFVYIVECSDGTYYCGYTTNLNVRINQHNNLNSGAKYTKYRRPVKLIYSEEYSSKSLALKREYAIKSLSRTAKVALVANRSN